MKHLDKPVIIFDGTGALCCCSMRWLRARALPGAFEFLPCQFWDRRARFPEIDEDECLSAVHLVMSDGRTLAGDEALPAILEHMKGGRWLASVLRLPGFRRLSGPGCAWVARHRYQVPCTHAPSLNPTDKPLVDPNAD